MYVSPELTRPHVEMMTSSPGAKLRSQSDERMGSLAESVCDTLNAAQLTYGGGGGLGGCGGGGLGGSGGGCAAYVSWRGAKGTDMSVSEQY
jgi:hypothetical protein